MTEAEQQAETAKMTREAIIAKLSDRWWRLNNLYWIQTKSHGAQKFKLNDAQAILYDDLHYWNLVLKARQLGFTTFFALFALDMCLFNPNISAGFIAHNREDAEDIFTKKIRFAYDRLPDWLKEAVYTEQESTSTLRLSNGSSIRVGTSLRSGTYQILHVSEMGKIAHKYPEKAKEIIAGALPTVPVGGFVFVESTFEGGKGGEFYKLILIAMANIRRLLGPLDIKFHFFNWTVDPSYSIPGQAEPQDEKYFAELEKAGIRLSPHQKAWYSAKKRTLGTKMQQEFPSTAEEALNVQVEGAYYGKDMTKLRSRGQVCGVPHEAGHPVFTFWDLGIDDSMSIWFIQFIGREVRVIEYYEATGEGFPFFKRVLDERRESRDYTYGQHFAPHDIKVRELATGLSRMKSAEAIGIKFERVPVVPSLDIAHDAVRDVLPRCWFDKDRCELGINGLEAYRQKVDEEKGVASGVPIHDWASHPASAFQTMAVAMKRGQIKDSGIAAKIMRDTHPRNPDGTLQDDGIIPKAARHRGQAISGGLRL